MSELQLAEVTTLSEQHMAMVQRWVERLGSVERTSKAAMLDLLKAATTHHLAAMATSTSTMLDFLQAVEFKQQPAWVADLLALDQWVEDELDRRLGRNEMENGA